MESNKNYVVISTIVSTAILIVVFFIFQSIYNLHGGDLLGLANVLVLLETLVVLFLYTRETKALSDVSAAQHRLAIRAHQPFVVLSYHEKDYTGRNLGFCFQNHGGSVARNVCVNFFYDKKSLDQRTYDAHIAYLCQFDLALVVAQGSGRFPIQVVVDSSRRGEIPSIIANTIDDNAVIDRMKDIFLEGNAIKERCEKMDFHLQITYEDDFGGKYRTIMKFQDRRGMYIDKYIAL